MPEQIIPSKSPCNDAIDKVTHNESYDWRLTGWTEAGRTAKPLKMFDAQPLRGCR